jgi:hypothetical protein
MTSGEYLIAKGFERDPYANRWVSPDGVEILGTELIKYEWVYIDHLIDVRRDVIAQKEKVARQTPYGRLFGWLKKWFHFYGVCRDDDSEIR